MTKKSVPHRFVVCVSNRGSDDLQVWKIYRVLPDSAAASEGYLRVVDESGEDYLYPEQRFVSVTLTPTAKKRLMARKSTAV